MSNITTKQKGDIKMQILKTDGPWVEGTLGAWKFQAKVFNTPSRYGIFIGRVSKLVVSCSSSGDVVFNYDRGFDNEKSEALSHSIGYFIAGQLEALL